MTNYIQRTMSIIILPEGAPIYNWTPPMLANESHNIEGEEAR